MQIDSFHYALVVGFALLLGRAAVSAEAAPETEFGDLFASRDGLGRLADYTRFNNAVEKDKRAPLLVKLLDTYGRSAEKQAADIRLGVLAYLSANGKDVEWTDALKTHVVALMGDANPGVRGVCLHVISDYLPDCSEEYIVLALFDESEDNSEIAVEKLTRASPNAKAILTFFVSYSLAAGKKKDASSVRVATQWLAAHLQGKAPVPERKD